ncbi:hypothetical protein AB5J72_41725 [Streptomyces sp. CG1]|uniref:hypothetical protein n=1 Tax=Streptomyces sp. CG1 TaxID=1287523 RepID=UPI0034E1D7E4
MTATLLSAPLVPDTALLRDVRNGSVGSMRPLYRRHYSAVYAYASTCAQAPLDAFELASTAFSELLQRLLAGQPVSGRGYNGCLRRELHSAVRSAAVARYSLRPESLAPGFKEWVASGASWPVDDDGDLATAFALLPESAQCLLWHSTIEQDDAASIARITGLRRNRLASLTRAAKTRLKQVRAELYLERREQPECRDALMPLLAEPSTGLHPEPNEHMLLCAGCQNVFQDIKRLNTYLERQLPARLLGWWPGRKYLRTKEITPTPLADPAFVLRAGDQAKTAGKGGCATRPSYPVARGRSKGRSLTVPRNRTSVALGALVSLAAASIPIIVHASAGDGPAAPASSASAPQGPVSRSARSASDGLSASSFTSAKGVADPGGPDVGLSSGSLLRFSNVSFSGGEGNFLEGLLSGMKDAAVVEFRLDSADTEPFARLAPAPYGELAAILVPISPISGVHDLYVTVQCPGHQPCVQLRHIATRRLQAPGEPASGAVS